MKGKEGDMKGKEGHGKTATKLYGAVYAPKKSEFGAGPYPLGPPDILLLFFI
jgi:hypothetical protein